MRLALAQINTTVGDLDGNRELILARLEEAKARGRRPRRSSPSWQSPATRPRTCSCARASYAPHEESLAAIARATHGIVALVGYPHFDRDLYNACAVCAGGEVKAIYRKRFLPNYGVFDEDRYFAPARDLLLLEHGGTLIGPTICEDMWQPGPPATDLALAGAQLLTNLSASPFHVGRDREREEMFATRARDNSCFVAFCNAVGGQDELIFDGHSLVLDEEGNVLARGPASRRRCSSSTSNRPTRSAGGCATCAAARLCASASRFRGAGRPHRRARHALPSRSSRSSSAALDELEQMRLALELGLRDYVEKNGFGEVVVGVSGGIDSALTGALAVEALGAERVHCVSMPSRYSSEETRADARLLAESLGTDFRELPIERDRAGLRRRARESFDGREPDLAEENLQARIRGRC